MGLRVQGFEAYYTEELCLGVSSARHTLEFRYPRGRRPFIAEYSLTLNLKP